jgi:hypothetical protein
MVDMCNNVALKVITKFLQYIGQYLELNVSGDVWPGFVALVIGMGIGSIN